MHTIHKQALYNRDSNYNAYSLPLSNVTYKFLYPCLLLENRRTLATNYGTHY